MQRVCPAISLNQGGHQQPLGLDPLYSFKCRYTTMNTIRPTHHTVGQGKWGWNCLGVYDGRKPLLFLDDSSVETLTGRSIANGLKRCGCASLPTPNDERSVAQLEGPKVRQRAGQDSNGVRPAFYWPSADSDRPSRQRLQNSYQPPSSSSCAILCCSETQFWGGESNAFAFC